MSENIDEIKRENITLTDEVVRLSNQIKILEGEVDSANANTTTKEVEIGMLLFSFKQTLSMLETVTEFLNVPDAEKIYKDLKAQNEYMMSAVDEAIKEHKASYDSAEVIVTAMSGKGMTEDEFLDYIGNNEELVL